ncbi:MAG: hypothetical protein E1N59_1051 [Puniceicoccaceae bacterium 5H]|nr:MAG: hypothetical protein E1N59_1051 [Puniceicoccaceae bacterium 5H]
MPTSVQVSGLRPATVVAHEVKKPAPVSSTLPKPKRDVRLDVLRGLFLVLMAMNHIPNPAHDLVVGPIGFLSVAEGFVFLAAFLCGLIFTKRIVEKGFAVARKMAAKRALTIYACHASLLLIGFYAAWQIGPSPQPTAWIFDRFLAHPFEALIAGLTLLYQPSFFDILPMYIVGALSTPWILRYTREHGWLKLGLGSAFIWLLAQFGAREAVEAPLAAHFPIYLGAFDPFAWQALWLGGLFLGQKQYEAMTEGRRLTIPRPWAYTALVVAGSLLVLRHSLPHLDPIVSQTVYPVMGKWHLDWGRVVNLVAVIAVCMSFSPKSLPEWPVFGFLNTIGRQSLSVFTAHLPLAVIGVTWAHVYQPDVWFLTGYFLCCLTFMWSVAKYQENRRQEARNPRPPRRDADASAVASAPGVPPHAVPPR